MSSVISTWTQAVVVLAVVVPGFVYQSSRRAVRGPDPEQGDATERVLRAVATSAVFACLYLVGLGPRFSGLLGEVRAVSAGTTSQSIPLLALGLLITAVVIPWVSARLVFYITTSQVWVAVSQWFVRVLRVRRQYNPVPRAWDFAFSTWTEGGWVRVLLEDGRWVGGYFGGDSYATGWPEPHELFVERGYVIGADGTFTDDVSAPSGLWVRCEDAVLVDFLPRTADDQD